jgi:hypothetical protein
MRFFPFYFSAAVNIFSGFLEWAAKALKVSVKKFPKGADPVREVSSRWPHLKVVQTEDSTISPNMLALGLEKMETEFREQWLHDINAGSFFLTHVTQV